MNHQARVQRFNISVGSNMGFRKIRKVQVVFSPQLKKCFVDTWGRRKAKEPSVRRAESFL